jgi:DtxR family Mn-dependent transcriptional regulator
MLSQSEENYLKAIYSLELEKEARISTSLIASKIRTKASSVSDMLKKLSDKELIDYEKYKGVSLTKSGKDSAVKIVRNHRIWEYFLVNKLQYTWNEVHEIAEQLEHIKSGTLIDRLDAYLKFPTLDPHGDPIPDKHGKIHKEPYLLLTALSSGDKATLIRVKDSSNMFLAYLDRNEVALNSEIKVISKESFDNSMVIKINNKQLTISHQISNNLFVQKIN